MALRSELYVRPSAGLGAHLHAGTGPFAHSLAERASCVGIGRRLFAIAVSGPVRGRAGRSVPQQIQCGGES